MRTNIYQEVVSQQFTEIWIFFGIALVALVIIGFVLWLTERRRKRENI